MRTMMSIALIGVGVVLSGCTSYVRTFDENDKQLGACVAHKDWFGPKVDCHGSANPKDQK